MGVIKVAEGGHRRHNSNRQASGHITLSIFHPASNKTHLNLRPDMSLQKIEAILPSNCVGSKYKAFWRDV